MSDEHDGVGSAGAGPETGTENTADARARTAVATRPLRPTGKRSRRGAASDTDAVTEADADAKSVTKNGGKAKTAKKGDRPGGRNPFTYVWTFLQQVVAELRKVIWPNRKQMISYTTVVLFFLAFMVALIGGVDYGLARLVMLVFG